MDYSKLSFPPYEYKEYPKWVDTKDGPVIVHDAKEEAVLKPSKRESK
jgi:hypothetical protein